jgi:hypothetical protein
MAGSSLQGASPGGRGFRESAQHVVGAGALEDVDALRGGGPSLSQMGRSSARSASRTTTFPWFPLRIWDARWCRRCGRGT